MLPTMLLPVLLLLLPALASVLLLLLLLSAVRCLAFRRSYTP
jgi:hypothetical protein